MKRRHDVPRHDTGWVGPDDAPHVLIEHTDGALGWAQSLALQQAGYTTAVCDGPDPRSNVGCPVLDGERCALAQEADAVISSVHPLCAGLELALALRDRYPARPVLRESPPAELQHHTDSLAHLDIIPFGMDCAHFVASVDEALAGR